MELKIKQTIEVTESDVLVEKIVKNDIFTGTDVDTTIRKCVKYTKTFFKGEVDSVEISIDELILKDDKSLISYFSCSYQDSNGNPKIFRFECGVNLTCSSVEFRGIADGTPNTLTITQLEDPATTTDKHTLNILIILKQSL